MATFDYGNLNQPFGMNTPSTLGFSSGNDKSSFDSSGMNYDSGMGISTPQFTTGQNNLPRMTDASNGGINPNGGQPNQPTQPTPTDGTLLGTVAPKPQAGPGTYNLQGFDTGKMNNAGYSSGKYTPAVREFYSFLDSGGAGNIGRNNLQAAIDHAKANGFSNAKAVGDDKIDFGDGNGPIDVIQSNGSIWFQNGQDRFGQPNQQGSVLGTTTAPDRQFAQPISTQKTVDPNQANQFAMLMQALFGSAPLAHMMGQQQPNNITMNGGGFTGLGPQANNITY